MPFSIRELPPLPGGTYSSANGINDSGVVVGTAQDGAGNQRAVYWIGGVPHEIPTPIGGASSIATAINGPGAIVGFMAGGPTYHGFLWDGVTVHDLGPAPDESRAEAINDAAEIAGSWLESATGVERAVIWSPGLVMTELPGLGFPHGNFAYAFANAPVIAGQSTYPGGERRASLWLDGTLLDLGTLGGTNSIARDAIALTWPDPAGTGIYVVGGAEFPGSGVDRRAFLWHKGTMFDLGTLPGWFASEAYAMNSALQVVGFAWSDPGGVNEHAVLWDSSGVISDLNAHITDPTWDVLYAGTAINNAGVIAGYGMRGGEHRGFILEPL